MARSTGFDDLDGLFTDDVRFKVAKQQGGATDRISRITKRTPEVMVKISGFGKGQAHIKAHLDYIGRNAKLELENERGEIISEKGDIKNLSKEWMNDTGKRNKNTRDTTNIVLSMPPGTNRNKVKNASREFAKAQFADNHQYVFVAHEDEKHPHVHLTVKNLGFDGSRLHIKKGDPQKWREQFAKELRVQGVEAEATPRRVRGVVKKPTKQPILHIRKKGKTPYTDKAKVVEAMKSMTSDKVIPEPWKKTITEQQKTIRGAWADLAKSFGGANPKMANQIKDFLVSMPELTTQNDELKKQLQSQGNIKQINESEIER
ncbi:relaxase/mobilization nuclease domain-containing protein [Thiolapillus sp.]|uniref:relaxase/mobilization nuclease domain-containing protein n=1 Tax=Thiolapillus sp. TaxID=2017437 RepID=UPI003AF61CA7